MKASHAVKIALVAIIAGAVVAVLLSPLRHQLTLAHARAWVTSERAHVQSLWWTPLALIAAYGIGCIFAIPATLFIASTVAPADPVTELTTCLRWEPQS